MTLSSMTGFARGQGLAGAYAWSWEIKSVNAKGLDIRFRLPPGWDAVEVAVRKRATEALARGTVYANLTVERKGTAPTVKINEQVLNAIVATLDRLDDKIVGAARPTLDGILALKGVIEITEDDEKPEDRRAAEAAIIAGFDQLLTDLVAMRREEGATLGKLLTARLDEIAELAARAEAAPGRKPEAIKARLARAGGDAAGVVAALRFATVCIRKRSCSPPRPTSARNSTGWPRMERRSAKCWKKAARLADGSTFWRRNSTANRIR